MNFTDKNVHGAGNLSEKFLDQQFVSEALNLSSVFDLSSVSIFRNQNTTDRSPTENATSTIPHNHKNSSELINQESFKVNSSLTVAESRFFPIGTPDLIPSTSNLISPFDVSTFGKQLLPLINVNIKEKVKDFANTFNEGADLIEDAIRDSWRNPLNPLNPHNYKHILSGPGLLKHLPFSPLNGLRKPVYLHKAPHAHKEKAPQQIETYSVDGMMHDYGINGYKHFEESILRELEKQEERKVEATIHTLFDHKDTVQIIQGKPYDYKTGWKPVAAPTKNYDDSSEEVNSQIVSPLHTSIFGSAQLPISNSHGFHDFDNLNGNTIHSTYSVHEEEVESKVKPVKARIASMRSVKTPPPTNDYVHSTTSKSRYRKRHNNNVVKTAVAYESSMDTGASGSHDAPKIVNKAKRNPPRIHVQSLTTTKPSSRTHSTSTRTVATDKPKSEVSTENSGKVSFFNSEAATRARVSSTSRATTTTTTIKPSRNVPREAAKFVDKTKATGYRGSVKFGQTTTKPPL